MSRFVAFRVDASRKIGHGHLYRCLALAEALQGHGIESHFLCRVGDDFPGLLIAESGHVVHALAPARSQEPHVGRAYDAWLGTGWQDDARDCAEVLARLGENPAWLVVDHYGIDRRWEAEMAIHGSVMVIDDLADRAHACAILVDQTLGRSALEYVSLVPPGCDVLAGAGFALLHSRYRQGRRASLEGRHLRRASNLLIAMGGVDAGNATGTVLRILADGGLPESVGVTVVLGHGAPWRHEIHALATAFPRHIEVCEGVADMVPLLSAADLAIGAAGGSAWERCCLGLPAILLVLADNQRTVAEALHVQGAAVRVEPSGIRALASLVGDLLASGERLGEMSAKAARLVDGLGAERVVGRMLG